MRSFLEGTEIDKRVLILIALIIAGFTVAWAGTMSGGGYVLSGNGNYYGGMVTGGGFSSSAVGDYYQARPVTGGGYIINPSFVSASWSFAPYLLTIDPVSAYNIAPVRAKISGTNFSQTRTVKLVRAGQADIFGTNVVVGASDIYCDFNIAGAQTGTWTVEVDDLLGGAGVLPNAFEVKSFDYNISLALNSPNPFDPARESTTIMYKLANNTNVTVVLFSTTADRLWKRDYLAGDNGGRAGENNIIWTGYTDYSELASNGVYLVHVIERSTGKTLARGKVAVIRR
jgi:hypothetical protein